MREIRALTPKDIDAYTDIAFNAYPSFKDLSDKGLEDYKKTALEVMEKDPIVHFFGMFQENKLIGVMRLFDFEMNLFGKLMPVSGLGFLGVHLMHKKEKIAKELVEFYENYYKAKNVQVGILLPFRPDFYKSMGYGIGTKMGQYRLPTNRIPMSMESCDLRYLNQENLGEILDCHKAYVLKNHGLIMKFGDEIRDLFGDCDNKVIGHYDDNGDLTGYMVFKFENGKAGNYTINNIYMKEMVYTDAQVLRRLLGFIRKQEDQVKLVTFNSQDENFHYLFHNPLNDTENYIPYGYLETNTEAIGVMYKMFSIEEVIKACQHRNYNHGNLTVKLSVLDTHNETLVEEMVLGFEDGELVLGGEDYQVSMTLNQSDFASLFFGSTSVKALYDLGLLAISDQEWLSRLNMIFYCDKKPMCFTDF